MTRKKCLLSSEATLLGWVCPGCSRLPPGVFGNDGDDGGGGGCDAGSCNAGGDHGCIGCDKYRDCGAKIWWTFAKPVICNSIRSSSNFVRRPCGSKLTNIVISILVKVAKIPDHCLVIKDQPVDHHLDHNIVVNKLPPVWLLTLVGYFDLSVKLYLATEANKLNHLKKKNWAIWIWMISRQLGIIDGLAFIASPTLLGDRKHDCFKQISKDVLDLHIVHQRVPMRPRLLARTVQALLTHLLS